MLLKALLRTVEVTLGAFNTLFMPSRGVHKFRWYKQFDCTSLLCSISNTGLVGYARKRNRRYDDFDIILTENGCESGYVGLLYRSCLDAFWEIQRVFGARASNDNDGCSLLGSKIL